MVRSSSRGGLSEVRPRADASGRGASLASWPCWSRRADRRVRRPRSLDDVTFDVAPGPDDRLRRRQRRRQDHHDADHPGRARRRRGRGALGRRAARPADRRAVRLHAGGARPLPQDDGPRAARLPRPAARDDVADAREPVRDAAASGSASPSAPGRPWRSSRWATSSASRSRPRWCTSPDVLVLDEPFSGLDPMAVDSWSTCCATTRRAACRCCSPATSSTWSSGSATTWSIIADGASSPPGRWPSCAGAGPSGTGSCSTASDAGGCVTCAGWRSSTSTGPALSTLDMLKAAELAQHRRRAPSGRRVGPRPPAPLRDLPGGRR